MISFDFAALLRAFITDGRTITIAALIFLDLLTGVAAALRTHTFDWQKLGNFYVSDVLPFLLCYAGVFVLVGILGASLPPDLGPIIAQIVDWAGAGVAIANLLGSIISNLSELRPTPPPRNLQQRITGL